MPNHLPPGKPGGLLLCKEEKGRISRRFGAKSKRNVLPQILLLSKEEYPSEAQGEVVCPFQEPVPNSLREERSKRNSKGRWLEP